MSKKNFVILLLTLNLQSEILSNLKNNNLPKWTHRTSISIGPKQPRNILSIKEKI